MSRETMDRKTSYRAQEFAERAGVTVRALHHYDRLGLLRPGRSAAGYRVYRERDFVRLGQIVTLQFIGFPLKQIRELLDRRELDLASTLHLHRSMMEEKRRRLDQAITALHFAEHAAADANAVPEALRKVVETIEMTNNREWTKKYYDEEARKALETRNRENPGLAEQGTRDWALLIQEVEQAVREKVDPASERAQKLAARWQALIRSFTGGNPKVEVGLKKLYADQPNWPSHFQKPYSDEVGAFISAASNKK